MEPIAIAGATGYIGGRLAPRLLEAGYTLRCLVRSPRKLEDREWAVDPRVEVVESDLTDQAALTRQLSGCSAAYYLVHSMMAADGEYSQRDTQLALTFGAAARDGGVGRIVYLGGLGETGASLSEHLSSRRNVEAALGAAGVPVTVLRAAMIIGSGSASFEILRYLVQRLPIMITPRWVSTRCQPIAVDNVLVYLRDVLTFRSSTSEVFYIGGSEVLRYREILSQMAEELGLRPRWIVPVPVLTPRLSSYWIQLVTPLSNRIARPLAEGLKNEVICRKTLHVFGRTPHVPHIYYYRHRKGTTQTWTPWEKLDLDIQGDHLIPVFWNRRLMLIWPIFTEKTEEKPITMPGQEETMQQADRYWDVQLAWSEYQHGRWSGSNLSEAVKFKVYQGVDNILFDTPVFPPEFALKPVSGGGGPDVDEGVGEDDDSGGTVSGNGTSTTTKQLVSTDKIAFKAFAFPETLVVLGYVRRDYRAIPVAGDAQIACVFGEFRFSGCRKIITTANHAQAARRNFALAPTRTEFDRMWFTSTGPGLVFFDGRFPVSVRNPIVATLDESPSIVGDVEPTVKNKNNVLVPDRTPSAFRVLAPHQDFQFINDRPSFFMDTRRTFMITANNPPLRGLTGWVDANVATTFRADFFGQSRPVSPEGVGPVRADPPLVVLAPGPNGRRVSRQLVPINLQPQSRPQTTIPISYSVRKYRFFNFHHPYVCDFEKAFNQRGIAGLLSLETQSKSEAQFVADYSPGSLSVLQPHPIDEVEFASGGAYENYNWELFLHVPLLIATRLMENQRFADAQRWFHYIFDPTGASAGTVPQRY